MEPFRKLSETYQIDTLKGHFPHHFDTRENQQYIGRIPSEAMLGAKNMMPDNYKEFHEWHEHQLHRTDWKFKEDVVPMLNYFRKLFYLSENYILQN